MGSEWRKRESRETRREGKPERGSYEADGPVAQIAFPSNPTLPPPFGRAASPGLSPPFPFFFVDRAYLDFLLSYGYLLTYLVSGVSEPPPFFQARAYLRPGERVRRASGRRSGRNLAIK
jgi:hypothetical protein